MYLLRFSATRSHGVVIPLTAALAIAKTLIKCCPEKKNVNIDLKNSFETQRLFCRMGYRKCCATARKVDTTKADIPQLTYHFKFILKISSKKHWIVNQQITSFLVTK